MKKHELTAATRRWYETVIRQYRLTTEAELRTLLQAAQCLDRIAECQAAIARDGMFTAGERGTVAHPAVREERQQRALYLSAVRQLGLMTPITAPGDDDAPT